MGNRREEPAWGRIEGGKEGKTTMGIGQKEGAETATPAEAQSDLGQAITLKRGWEEI